MDGKKIKLFTLFGFTVKVHASWIFIAFLVTWTLARGYFPTQLKDLDPAMYWYLGAIGALGLFISLILHELSHSLVARRMGLSIRGITLFIFGGVAEMDGEPENPKTEFWMAIAGPAMSVVLGVLFFFAKKVGLANEWPAPATVVLDYLSMINFALAIFNCLPGFPMDGGRILRAILWKWKNDLPWATHKAVKAGNTIGTMMMFLGAFNLLAGNVVGGIWWFLIALFLKGAGKNSETFLMMRLHLKGDPVRKYMVEQPMVLDPQINLADAVRFHFFPSHHRNFPVVQNGQLLGILTVEDIQKVPSEEWPMTPIQKVYTDMSPANTVSPDMDALDALQKMNKENREALLVYDNGLKGLLTLKDLLAFLAIKLDLKEGLADRLYRF